MRILDLRTKKATTVFDKTAVALGFFDGVHIGHRSLLLTTAKESEKRNISSLVLTFSERGSANMKQGARHLCTEEERLEHFAELGMDYALLLDFESVKNMSPQEFVSEILIGVCHSELAVCGYNFRFGKGASGNTDTLISLMDQNGEECIVCPPYTYGGEPVSSTRIRKCVSDGDMASAMRLLGRPFSISAPICHGKGLGHGIGIPTANQRISDNTVDIRNGVYATRIFIDGKYYYSLTNVGVRPTVDTDGSRNCETHILNYNEDLYGKSVKVEFLSFIRDEMRFSSLEELKNQIYKDIDEVKKWQKDGQS